MSVCVHVSTYSCHHLVIMFPIVYRSMAMGSHSFPSCVVPPAVATACASSNSPSVFTSQHSGIYVDVGNRSNSVNVLDLVLDRHLDDDVPQNPVVFYLSLCHSVAHQ